MTCPDDGPLDLVNILFVRLVPGPYQPWSREYYPTVAIFCKKCGCWLEWR